MIDGLLKYAVGVPIIVWLILSPIIFIWWNLTNNNIKKWDPFIQEHTCLSTAIYLGAFFSLLGVLSNGFVVLGRGFETIFGNEFFTGISFWLCVFLLGHFDEFDKLRVNNQKLTIEFEILKRKYALRNSNGELLLKEKERSRFKYQELYSRGAGRRFPVGLSRTSDKEIKHYNDEERELIILKEFMYELDDMIKKGETPVCQGVKSVS